MIRGMIQVTRDTEGLRLVLAEMLERDHDLLRLTPQMESKSAEQQGRMMASVAKITLSPGYARWAGHLMLLEQMQKLNLPLGDLLAVELQGLQVLHTARMVHRGKHPHCFACGMPQHNRFQLECADCGAKFSRRRSR